MPKYENRNTKSNEEELDPCLAAEVRMKKAIFSSKTKRILWGLILLLLFIALLTIGLVLLLVVYPKYRDANNAQISKAAIKKRTIYIELKPSNKIYEPEENDGQNHVEDISDEDDDSQRPAEIKEDYKPIKTVYIDLKPSNKNLEDATVLDPQEPVEIKIIPKTDPGPPRPFEPEVQITTTTSSAHPQPPRTPPPRVHVDITTRRPYVRPTHTQTTVHVIGSDPVPEPRPSLVTPVAAVYEVISTSETKETCDDYRKSGNTKSGVYKMTVPGFGDIRSLCLMENDFGWNVLQRRTGPELIFWNRTFDEYANGFGYPTGDHWLGLEKVHAYVKRGHRLQLRIVLQHDLCKERGKCSGEGESGYWYADWDFKIGDKTNKYKLQISSMTNGNLSDLQKDPMQWMNNDQPFTAADSDNDKHKNFNCALHRHFGAWWHKDCTFVALNGEYGNTNSKGRGMHWTYQAVSSTNVRGHGAIMSYVIKPKNSLMLFRVKT